MTWRWLAAGMLAWDGFSSGLPGFRVHVAGLRSGVRGQGYYLGFSGLAAGGPALPGRGGRYVVATAGRVAGWRSRRARARMALRVLWTAAHRWISVPTMSPR